jgi:acyl-CoA thioester hydrolase
MPAVHTATFRIRHYECDAYGHLNNANYARLMEEAAFEASAAVGYPKERYEREGYLWLARETDLEYLVPARYGDTLEIRTWVGDFRRVRSRRFYEFRKAGEDALIARAATDWVYLEAETGRPATVPPEMIAAFAPEGDVPPAAPRERFPDAPPPPPGVFIARRRVEWRDIDTARHVNNAAYINYIEDAGWQVAAAHGWPAHRVNEEGFAIIARRHQIEYRLPALLDDELEIATYVSDVKRASANRHYRITRPRDGALVMQARTLYVWVNLHTLQPMRVPPHFLADFTANIAASQ